MPPRHRFIADLIRRSIAAGEFTPGVDLPPPGELAQRYAATAEEMQLALTHLASSGLILVHDDETATLAQVPTQTHIMSTSASIGKPLPSRDEQFSSAGDRLGLRSTHRTETEVAVASLMVANMLELMPGAQVVHRRTLRLTNDQPSVLEDSYHPSDLDADDVLTAVDDIDRHLEALGYQRALWTDTIGARSPAAEEANLLRLESHHPVIEHTRVLYSGRLGEQSRPVTYIRSVFDAGRHRLVYKHKQSDAPSTPAHPVTPVT